MVRVFVFLMGLLVMRVSFAHPALSSAVYLDVNDHYIKLETQMPLDQLRVAVPELPAEDAALFAPATGAMLRRYLLHHIKLLGADGQTLKVQVESLESVIIADAPYLIARLRFDFMEPTTSMAFILHDSAILHPVVSHKIYVTLRSDFRNRIFAHDPQLLGIIHYQHEDLPLKRERGSLLQGFSAIVMQGAQHIGAGTDHLLFLICLLLPAPLVVRGKCWESASTSRQCVLSVLKLVTAFTVGHALTLTFAALGWVHVPSRSVEILVAASILVSALHAFRPVIGRQILVIAAGFGLIHGLAFSNALSTEGLDTMTTLLTLAGFNVGIEAMQLLIVLVVVPGLMLVAKLQGKLYHYLRAAGAGLAALAALNWLIERTWNINYPWSDLLVLDVGRGLALVAALYLLGPVTFLARLAHGRWARATS